MKRQSATLRLALQFIQSILNTNTELVNYKLPPIKELARCAGVSVTTMLNAVRMLQEQGVLKVKKRGGIYVNDLQQTENTFIPHGFLSTQKWQRVKEKILLDIFDGAFKFDTELPSLAIMANRYGVSLLTMRKILMNLTEQGYLVQSRRVYLIRRLGRRQSQSTIVVLTPQLGMAGHLIYWRHQQLARSLERLSIETNIKLEFLGYGEQSGKIIVVNRGTYVSCQQIDALFPSILGIILLSWSNSFLVIDLIQELSKLNVPIIVLDEAGNRWFQQNPAFKSNISVLPMAYTRLCGEHVGRYLLKKGHRRVGFFSPFHKSLWSVNRLAGLVSAFEAAGLRFCVSSFVLESYGSYYDFYPHTKKTEIGNQTKELFLYLEKKIPALSPPIREELSVFRENLNRAVIVQRLRDALVPLFAKGLADSSITVWVSANDMTACHALSFLLAHGVSVPHQISIIGFDNDIEAYKNGLDSYDFNLDGVASRMVRWILQPGRLLSKSNVYAIEKEVEGFVIERGSVATLL